MTEFTKTKISFALALLGTFFALHPVLENLEKTHEVGFSYLGVYLPLYYAYGLAVALLALSVYCFAMGLVSHRAYSWSERLGNSAYAAAVMVLPVYAGLYVASVLADRVHSQLAWAAPATAFSIGLLWILGSHLVAVRLRRKLSEQDRTTVVRQLAEQEMEALAHAREMFAGEHYDLSVIAAWRALEARLRRVFTARRHQRKWDSPEKLIAAVEHAGLLDEVSLALLKEVHQAWLVAIGFTPVGRESADKVLHGCRLLLSSLPADDPVHHHQQEATGKLATPAQTKPRNATNEKVAPYAARVTSSANGRSAPATAAS